MKKLALAALVALASTSAHAAVVISFTGSDTFGGTNAPVQGTITIDTAKLPANGNPSGTSYYSSTDDSGYFLSVVLNGTSLPLAGAAGDNLIASYTSISDFPSEISFTSETDSGLPSQDSWFFSISTFDQVPATTAFGGVALPDFRQAFAYGDLNFAVEHFGFQNSDYSFLSGAVTSLTYTEDAAAVPEPASWAMMVGGFGLIGGALRRRRTAFAAA